MHSAGGTCNQCIAVEAILLGPRNSGNKVYIHEHEKV